MKRPAFQFYPADWRKDIELRACSIAARGLWIDLMCVAHECEPYGHLVVNGKAMTHAQIAGQVCLTLAQCKALVQELIDNGVASVTEEGVIFSRRMVKDEAVRNARAEGGKAGSEHGQKGAVHGLKGGRPRKDGGIEKPPFEPPSPPPNKPPPSSSSSSSEEQENPPASRVPPTADAAARPTKKCPKGFALTPDLEAWATEHCPGVNPHAELEKLKDHTFSSARTDWPGTWRNWMRKAHDSRPNARAQGQASGGYAARRENQLIGAAILTGTYRPEGCEKAITPDFLSLDHDDGKAA